MNLKGKGIAFLECNERYGITVLISGRAYLHCAVSVTSLLLRLARSSICASLGHIPHLAFPVPSIRLLTPNQTILRCPLLSPRPSRPSCLNPRRSASAAPPRPRRTIPAISRTRARLSPVTEEVLAPSGASKSRLRRRRKMSRKVAVRQGRQVGHSLAVSCRVKSPYERTWLTVSSCPADRGRSQDHCAYLYPLLIAYALLTFSCALRPVARMQAYLKEQVDYTHLRKVVLEDKRSKTSVRARYLMLIKVWENALP